MESIRELQAYGYIFFTIFLVIVLYSYIYHLYKSEKDGKRNYEKYSNMALHDNIDDVPVEKREIPLSAEKEK
ncbi:MAG: cytochrome c oxidase, cbb3-type, CcoQ subunit [Sulfurospirillaceae bacterium]|nr:cytochrome c oxidase, cbb3-type, CcoQ subunit [Sulfurospirillaceae bacterium]